MFHNMPKQILKRMQYLERLDARHRKQDISHLKRLRQIPPATGKFLALVAASAPDGTYLEIGTSAGYSTLWLTLACREVGRKITTFEVLEEKASLAMETFKQAGVEAIVDLVTGDARQHLAGYKDVAFCFLDAEKKYYNECFQAVVPNMVPGGILVADNVITHQEILKGMVAKALKDKRVDSMIVPIGSGLLMCRKF
ncbi:MAG: O-methyltransferase [Candidatus Eisenbacteria bacterium]